MKQKKLTARLVGLNENNLYSNLIFCSYMENYEGIYYTKIAKLDSTNNMKYEYTLTSYDKNGKSKKLKFKTVRGLKDQAYLKLIVKATGVNKWEEVKFEDLPAKVQNVFK